MKLLALLILMFGAGVAYLAWGIILPWLLVQVPATAQYYGVFKIACYLIVAYFGGVGLPLIAVVCAGAALFGRYGLRSR